MTPYKPDSCRKGVEGSPPVMCCHPKGGATTRLVRGAAPSTPHDGYAHTSHHGHASRHGHAYEEHRRRCIKRFFRVTAEESAAINSHAAEAGLEPSSYMRIQSLGKSKVRKCRRIRADWSQLRRCMGVINKAGNVVNQFVLLLRRFGWADSKEANTAFSELARAARAIVSALRRSR